MYLPPVQAAFRSRLMSQLKLMGSVCSDKEERGRKKSVFSETMAASCVLVTNASSSGSTLMLTALMEQFLSKREDLNEDSKPKA